MRHLQGYGEVFQSSSTSYEHYIKALCKAINFPFDHTYCTKVTLDNYTITAEEKQRLKAIAEEIAKMPLIQIPATAKSLADFSVADQALVQRLDQIFWEEIPQMTAGKLISEVKTVGGEQKAEAIKDATSR